MQQTQIELLQVKPLELTPEQECLQALTEFENTFNDFLENLDKTKNHEVKEK